MLIVSIHAFGVLMGFNCHDNGSYFWASQAGLTIIYLKMDLFYLRVTTVVFFITLRYNNKLKKIHLYRGLCKVTFNSPIPTELGLEMQRKNAIDNFQNVCHM